MNVLRFRKLTQYITVRVLFRSNPAILAKLPNGEEYIAALEAEILAIQSKSSMQEEGTKTIKDQKKTLKGQFVAELFADAGKLKAYVTYKGNKLLIDFCTITENKLNKMNDQELLNYASTLYKEINNSLGDLTKYLLTADTQTALLDLTSKYDAICPELANAKTSHKTIATDVETNFQNADAILVKLDTQMELVRTSDSDFYKQYKLTRKLDYRSDSNDLVGRVLDAVTGAGLPNATLTFALNDSTAAPIVKTSAEKGGFQIKTIAPGLYTVVITKIGYQTQTLPITIIGDDQFSLEVKLVKG